MSVIHPNPSPNPNPNPKPNPDPNHDPKPNPNPNPHPNLHPSVQTCREKGMHRKGGFQQHECYMTFVEQVRHVSRLT